MASHGGKKAFFGTNPLAFGAPVREGSDVILDMATTHFTWNKVKIYRDEGRALPEGVAVDREGAPTTDPHTARALLPTGSHKGFALAAMVEIMTSVMARGLTSPEVAPMYAADLNGPRGLSQSYLVLKPSNLKGDALFEDALQSLISALVGSEPLQDLGFPGSQEERIAVQRLRDGIPLDTATYSRFRKLGEVFGVEL
jgi:ureidoglycolate dehydrogenase (NAD+)